MCSWVWEIWLLFSSLASSMYSVLREVGIGGMRLLFLTLDLRVCSVVHVAVAGFERMFGGACSWVQLGLGRCGYRFCRLNVCSVVCLVGVSEDAATVFGRWL